MKKKIILVMLAITVLTGNLFHPMAEMKVLATDPQPQPEEIISGDYGYANLSNGNVEILKYYGEGGDIVIPDRIDGMVVAAIEELAFYTNEKITGVVIPESVTYIGSRAFASCENLKSVTLPEGVKFIVGGAFSDCKNMEKLLLDEKNDNFIVENGILYDKEKKSVICCLASKKGTVIIPEGVTKIESNAFGGCSAMESVIIPDSVTHIAGWAFRGCTGLMSVSIPGNAYLLNTNVFEGCSNLEEIVVDKNNADFLSIDGMLYHKLYNS